VSRRVQFGKADWFFILVSDSERVLIVRDALAPNHFYVVVALALFGFASIWPYYPAIGAGFAFIGFAGRARRR